MTLTVTSVVIPRCERSEAGIHRATHVYVAATARRGSALRTRSGMTRQQFDSQRAACNRFAASSAAATMFW